LSFRGRFASCAGLALALACACGGRERAAKAEAAGIVRAVAALRAAPNAAKATLLPGLEGVGCSDAQVCETKRVCVAAYEKQGRALELTDRARTRLDTGVDASHAAELNALLGEAERELQKSRALADQCAELEGALRRRFEL
jgi:hypothetical protein